MIFIATPTDLIGQVVTSGIGWMGTFANAIVSNNLILLFVGVSLVGLGIGLFQRLKNG